MSRFLPPSSVFLALVLTLAGCQFTFDRALDPGDIRGTLVVVDASGKRVPAANARVSLENAPVAVRSDASGRFVVRGVPSGVYALSLTWSPAAGATGEPAALRLRNINLSEEAGAIDLGTIEIGGLGAVSGVVVGDEVDEVEAILEGVGRIAVENGAFAFNDLAAGDYEVALIGQGGVWPGGSVTVRARSATQVEIDTRTPPLTIGSITGKVSRSDGGALTGLTVFLAGADSSTDAFDSEGLWLMTDVPAGVYTLVAQAPGMLTTQVPFVVVAGAVVAPDLVLVPRSVGCAAGGDGLGDANDADADGVPDESEPDVCLCHPGHVDANEDGACDLPDEHVPPVGCQTNDDCVGDAAGGLCSVSRGRCVECLSSTDCGSNEFCNVESLCEPFGNPPECESNDDCADHFNGAFCLPDFGVCVGCLNDQDCGSGQLCDQFNTCETIVSPPECETNDDCVEHVNGAFCLPDAGVCVGCVTDQDCDLGEFCSELNVCETVVTPTSCESNDDCVQQEGSPVCRLDTGACVECLLDDDCWRGICRDNNTCGPPPECYVDGDCAENPGFKCDVDAYLCVECLDNSDCASGVCLEDQTCEPVPECEAAVDCVGHPNGAQCLLPEGICVECTSDLDCSEGICSDQHVCEPEPWSIEFGASVVRQGSHLLVPIGSVVTWTLVNLPENTLFEFASAGSPPVAIEPNGTNSLRFHATAIGTVHIQGGVALGGETEYVDLVIQVVHDPARAVFFDPDLGNDANEGTLDEPKRDPVAWLAAMSPTTTGRHLYVRRGDITLPVAAPGDLEIDSASAGTEPIIITGGYQTDELWTRDLTWARTRFVQSENGETRFLVKGSGTDVVLDGVVVENENGVVCTDKARLRLLNSQVIARRGHALETTDCDGFAIGNVLMAGDDEWLDAAVVLGQADMASSFRILHNLVHAPKGGPFVRKGLLGGDVRFNIFLHETNDFWIDAAREFDGNTFETLDDSPMVESGRLATLNRTLMPQEPNKQYRCTGITDTLGLEDLRIDGWVSAYSQEDCLVRTPMPVLADPIGDYALRFDRAGAVRPDDGRNRGPVDLGLGQAQHQVSSTTTDRTLTVGVPYIVEGQVTNPEAMWEMAQAEGMELEITVMDSQTGRYQIIPRSVGGAGLRLVAQTIGWDFISRTSSAVVRFDVRPSGNLVFVDFNAATDGDGTELSPRNVWPTALQAGTDVLVAEASTDVGAKLAPGWLPDGVRVFGGYARDVDGRFIRRLAVAETNLGNASGTTVQIEMGNPLAEATTRVVDGVTFTSASPLQSALVVAGPLTLLRSRVINPYAEAPAVLEVQEPAYNVAVVGSTIAYRPDSEAPSAIDLVRLYSYGDTTFLFNDLHRGFSMSGGTTGSAFRVYDSAAKGIFAGNRYWIDNMGTSTYVFFDASMASTFSPSVLSGNSYAERGSATITATNIDSGDWDSLGTTEEFANGWGDGCATAWPASSLWAAAPKTDCPNAYDGGQRANALEATMPPEERIGVDYDYLGRRRQESGSTSGATVLVPEGLQ